MDTENTNPKESISKQATNDARFMTELEMPEDDTRSGSTSQYILGQDSNGSNLVDFEERLKKCDSIKKLLVMSPSIPNGFDMNCTTIDVDDFSTVICQALLSNDHIMGLKAQGYMNLEQRLEKHKHVYTRQQSSAIKLKEK